MLSPNTILQNRYRVVRELGHGGMGEVWRAKHKMLAREAAIKLIRPEVLQASTGRQEATLRKRFEREAQLAAGLQNKLWNMVESLLFFVRDKIARPGIGEHDAMSGHRGDLRDTGSHCPGADDADDRLLIHSPL